MKKVLVSDYDQTFYINDEDIEINKKEVDKFMKFNNLFIIATGRSYLDFHIKLDIYKFKYNYVILNHGATIIDNHDNILFNTSISNDVISKIENDLELEKSISYFCCSGVESRVDFRYKDLTKINVKYETLEYAMEKVKFINDKYGDYVNAYYVTGNSIEIISKYINKKDAIEYLMKLVDAEVDNVYTIGDGYSDIEMVKEFKGCCMEQSVAEVKDCAIKEYLSVSDMIEDILNSKI